MSKKKCLILFIFAWIGLVSAVVELDCPDCGEGGEEGGDEEEEDFAHALMQKLLNANIDMNDNNNLLDFKSFIFGVISTIVIFIVISAMVLCFYSRYTSIKTKRQKYSQVISYDESTDSCNSIINNSQKPIHKLQNTIYSFHQYVF